MATYSQTVPSYASYPMTVPTPWVRLPVHGVRPMAESGGGQWKATSARGWEEFFGPGPNGEYQALGLQHRLTGQRVPHRAGQCLRLVRQEDDSWVPVDYCNLRVTNLPPGMSLEAFLGLWTQFSGIHASSVKADKLQPRKKSAGFISFDTPDEAKVALSAMNGAGAQGFKMKVSYHRPNLNPAEKRDLAAQ